MKNILVVDDTPFVRELLTDCLASAGYQVRTADGVEAAQAMIDEEPPQLVVTDLLMPDVDGYELLAWLGQEHPRVAALVCSVLADPASVQRAARLGAQDFIIKPFEKQRLLEGVEQVLAATGVKAEG